MLYKEYIGYDIICIACRLKKKESMSNEQINRQRNRNHEPCGRRAKQSGNF